MPYNEFMTWVIAIQIYRKLSQSTWSSAKRSKPLSEIFIKIFKYLSNFRIEIYCYLFFNMPKNLFYL